MVNRRGFLSVLGFGAAAIAADADLLVWTPGKLVSVPPVVRVPQFRQFGCDFEMSLPYGYDASFSRASRALDLVAGENFSRYIAPAVARLASIIDARLIANGKSAAVFYSLEPCAGGSSVVGPLGKLPSARVLQFYDPYNDRLVSRVDVLVKI
jgi:hypothetical protein